METLRGNPQWVKATESWSVANRMGDIEGSWIMSLEDMVIISAFGYSGLFHKETNW